MKATKLQIEQVQQMSDEEIETFMESLKIAAKIQDGEEWSYEIVVKRKTPSLKEVAEAFKQDLESRIEAGEADLTQKLEWVSKAL